MDDVPGMTPETEELIRNTLLFLYADQIGVRQEDLDVSVKKKEESPTPRRK